MRLVTPQSTCRVGTWKGSGSESIRARRPISGVRLSATDTLVGASGAGARPKSDN
jgi:hypothetical protein